MKIGVMPIACAIVLLTGCGLSDQYATFMPKILRQPSTEPAQPDPEPDVKALIRANADTPTSQDGCAGETYEKVDAAQ